TIGDELLIGQVLDTNFNWLAKQLAGLGINVVEKRTIRDTQEAIKLTLEETWKKTDLLIFTGGLGPTKDDVTKSAIADFFGVKLVRNQEVLEHVKAIFASINKPFLEVNAYQADLPANVIPLKNELGTAPGMLIQDGRFSLISMPGVPYEMEKIFEDNLHLINVNSDSNVFQRTILTSGIGESALMKIIEKKEKEIEDDRVNLSYLPSYGTARLRLTTYSGNKILNSRINEHVEDLIKLIGKFYVVDEDLSLEEYVYLSLKKNGFTLSVAESCTGGYLSSLITSIPGSSAVFRGGIVPYSNDIKINEVSVDESNVNDFGAVSQQVVEQLASGVREKFDSTYGIGISGIAGPGGGTKEKPVGTVWIAIAGKERVESKLFHFSKNRSVNIKRTAYAALNMLRIFADFS
ncbi:MAG: CinA family nicotinamide mononucleotide deamidase-related protein, partial [Flavobacteriales bacterium]|nr:CinA family nicotinamide mononucleotide deamidase-related protein [Flavobacteriales bacterium]